MTDRFTLADIRAKAADVFGSEEAGDAWLIRPALALNGQKPVDMLDTEGGRESVGLLLIRLEYSVYT